MKRFNLLIFPLVLFSCNNQHPNNLEGAYAREYNYEFKKLDGTILGMVHVRDTLIIAKTDDGYRIENRFWRKNDYDTDGWQNREHSGEQKHDYMATYDKTTHSITAEMNVYAPLYWDDKQGLLYDDKNSDRKWKKVK